MRLRRHLTALVAAAGAAVLPCSAAAFADLTPSPSPSGTSSELPILVTLGGVRPLAPQPGDTVTVHGTLRNLGDAPLSDLTAQLLVSRTKIGSRGEFDAFADDQTGDPPIDAIVAPDEQVVLPRPTLATGGQESFSISLPVDELQLPEVWQVYEMAVVVDGDTALGHVPVGRLRTFLPWAPLAVPGVGSPTRLAWIWPLVDRPHRSDGGSWLDDDLADALAPGGRLGRLLTAGDIAVHQQPPPPPKPAKSSKKHHKPAPPAKPKVTIQQVPVTWVIDPALVDDVRTMANGYKVRSADGTRDGTGKTLATHWFDQLKQDVGTTEFFGTPYADPDVAAAARGGLAQEVQFASTDGDAILSDTKVFGRSPLPYAWPPDGLADQRTLDTFFAAGKTTLVLDSAAMPIVGAAPNETPGAHTRLTTSRGSFDVLLADSTLNQVVDDGARSTTSGGLDVQRLLSELLMIQAERPFDQRSLVLTPSRRWAPSASYANALLADSGKVPWIEPVSLSSVAEGPVYDTVKRGPTVYPELERAFQLPRNYIAGVAHIKHLVETFGEIAQPTGDALTAEFDDGVRRLLSSAWRSNPVLADRFDADLLNTVNRTMAQVHIASRGSSLVTLTSHSGTVPVTVANDLDIPVRVIVRVKPDQHLVVKNGHAIQVIPAHRQFPVDIHATAQTSGVFGLTVQLTTPSGKPYGAPVPLRIRSTAYGATALLITGGATAVLLLTVVVRLIRRARAARRTAPVSA